MRNEAETILAAEILGDANSNLFEVVTREEKRLIAAALRSSNGRISKTARILGVSHQALASMIDARHSDLKGARAPKRSRGKPVTTK